MKRYRNIPYLKENEILMQIIVCSEMKWCHNISFLKKNEIDVEIFFD